MKLTATGKEQALVDFYAQISRDASARPGVFVGTATELAARARIGRAYLSRLLNGNVTGKNTWKHLLPLLSIEALFRLKQCSAWNKYAEAELRCLCWSSLRVDTIETDFGVVRLVADPFMCRGTFAVLRDAAPVTHAQAS